MAIHKILKSLKPEQQYPTEQNQTELNSLLDLQQQQQQQQSLLNSNPEHNHQNMKNMDNFSSIKQLSEKFNTFELIQSECVNGSANSSESRMNIADFYSNKCILLTGATGFLGKVVLWKLMSSCKSFDRIYLLMRPRRDQTVEERLRVMLNNKPFDWLQLDENMKSKIIGVEADMVKDGLGLSDKNKSLLIDQVNVVFHSAASVKFDALLKDSYNDNVKGTRSLLELADNMKNLDAFVHVSTAYSNCNQSTVEEHIYPLKQDPDELCNFIENAQGCELTDTKLLEGRPNTYTFTKALAEQLVAKREGKFPVCIVRPSIVISSAREPCPGWVDNVNGIAGLGSLAAMGLLRTIDWDYHAKSDMVPVDYVTNCMLCAAVETKTKSSSKMVIYNMTSGNINPISWGQFFDLAREAAKETPSTKMVRPMIEPPKVSHTNQATLLVTNIFSELLFAYVIDTLLVLLGYKRLLVKITKKMHHGYTILKPFTTKQWNFQTNNVLALIDSMSDHEKNNFLFDMRQCDWKNQAWVTWQGARELILKDEPSESSFQIGRKRQLYVTVAHHFLTSTLLILLSYVIIKVSII